jgi:tetratricopeptide (TPR) repeat protein
MRKMFFPLVGWALLTSVLMCKPAASPAQTAAPASTAAATVRPYSAVSAPEWDALFNRTSGWTGADGVYSVPLTSVDTAGQRRNSTLWTFNDTFIGTVNGNGDRIGARIVHNTTALLSGNQPDPNRIQFYFGQSQGGEATARLLPSNPSERWLWPNAGIVANNKIYLYTLRMKPLRRGGGDGVFDSAYEGISLLSDKATSPQPFQTYTQVNAPLYAPSTCDRGSIIFGQALLPHSDGYLYIYGVRNDLDSKKLLVARVLPEKIEDFTTYQFWDGKQWSTTLQTAAPITDQMSSEFSVTPLPDGRFILVFQLNDFLSRTVAVRYGNSPVGPWGDAIPVWNSREEDLSLHTLTYGAKAHPQLSRPGELLISYHTSTSKNSEQYDHADIYRPRFIRLSLSDTKAASTAIERQAVANQSRRAEAETLIKQAVQQSQARKLEESLRSSQRALQIYQQIGDRARSSTVLHTIGNTYLELKQYPQALQSFQAALDIQQDMNNRVQEGITLSGIGQTYDYQGDYPKALEFYQKSLAVRREVSDRCGEGTTLTRMGGTVANQKQYPQALELFQQALPIHEEVGNRLWQAITFRNMGNVYVQQEEWTKARKAYQQALAIYQAMGDRAAEEATRQRIEALRR